jgi:hypothetical protein
MASSLSMSSVTLSILGTLPPTTITTLRIHSLTSAVACHDLIGEHLRKHRFHGCLLLPKYGLSEEEYRILELSVVQVDNGRPATRLLESSVEDLKAVCILYHVSFNYEQQELLDVHKPLL